MIDADTIQRLRKTPEKLTPRAIWFAEQELSCHPEPERSELAELIRNARRKTGWKNDTRRAPKTKLRKPSNSGDLW